MSNKNEQQKWDSSLAFLMAMIGAAVGLGNIWRFSYVLYSNGGGAFFIPYFTAILIMGIPFLILEYGIGFSFKKSFARILEHIKPKLEIIGWILALLVFIVCCYYLVIVAWDLIYLVGSPFQIWGNNPGLFFSQSVGGGSDIGGIERVILPAVVGVAVMWIIIWFISHRSVEKGIGKVSKFLIPLLFIIMGIIVVFAFTLPGHELGIDVLLQPDWSSLTHVDIWISAFAQIIFSLSMGQAIAITYASYLDKNARLNDYVLLVVGSNSGFEIFTAFGVFAILGFMAVNSGIPIDQLIAEGTSLIFIVFPTIFDAMGGIGKILGPLFFLAILFAGITSAVGFFEPLANSLADKFRISRKRAATILCIIGFLISLCFTSGIGSYLVSIVDGFVNEFGILFIIALQCIIFGWLYGIDHLVDILNKNSLFKVGRVWIAIIKYILPVILIGIWLWGLSSLLLSLKPLEAIVGIILLVGVIGGAALLTKYGKSVPSED